MTPSSRENPVAAPVESESTPSDGEFTDDPSNSALVYTTGLAFYRESRWHECVMPFERVVTLDAPGVTRRLNACAYLIQALGFKLDQPERAIDLSRDALKHYSEDQIFWYHYSRLT